jgi:hypothetical protein
MNISIKSLTLVACAVAANIAAAQAPAPPSPPPVSAAAATTPQQHPVTKAAAGAAAQAEAGEPRADTSRPAQRAGQKAASPTDRVALGTATVTGDREQPKVMYIVPWKRSDIGDLNGKPMNSLVDEILAPVDRDEFKRQVVYYQAVSGQAPVNGAPAKPPQQGEK